MANVVNKSIAVMQNPALTQNGTSLEPSTDDTPTVDYNVPDGEGDTPLVNPNENAGLDTSIYYQPLDMNTDYRQMFNDARDAGADAETLNHIVDLRNQKLRALYDQGMVATEWNGEVARPLKPGSMYNQPTVNLYKQGTYQSPIWTGLMSRDEYMRLRYGFSS